MMVQATESSRKAKLHAVGGCQGGRSIGRYSTVDISLSLAS